MTTRAHNENAKTTTFQERLLPYLLEITRSTNFNVTSHFSNFNMIPTSSKLSSMFVLLLLTVSSCNVFARADNDLVIAGYLPEYRTYINVNNTAPYLTDLILFSIEPNGATGRLMGGQCCLDASHYKLAREARAHRNHFEPTAMKLWVSVGGAGRSSGFLSIAKSPSSRRTFIQDAIALCQKEYFDGIDIDWQQLPSKEDSIIFGKFLVQTAKALHQEQLLLSVTTRDKLPKPVLQELDRVHFMAYDLIIPNGPSHHADYQVVTQIVDDWLINRGYPPEKIVLGIPGYARHRDNPGQVKTFAELVDDGLNPTAAGDEWKGFFFDSPKLIHKKMAYVKKNQLCGVFFWELGHDKQEEDAPAGWLLEAAAGVKEVKDEL
jgi:chitinase